MWIKICGLTGAEAVAAALAVRVDALGFVFTESLRRVTPAQAVVLAHPARSRAACVAVTRHPTQALIDEVLEVFRPDLLQGDAAELEQLRLPATLERLPVLRAAAGAARSLPRRLLFEGAVSGSGTLADWQAAQAIARRTQLVLAGGLTPANVAAAIGAVRPFGVDVSSGVEAAPGHKSPALIASFVAGARLAAASGDQSEEQP
jgi:phosphoribosylanthranilate isomerase